jgi:hypothetical protein
MPRLCCISLLQTRLGRGQHSQALKYILPLIPPRLPASSRYLHSTCIARSLDRLHSKNLHPTFHHSHPICYFFLSPAPCMFEPMTNGARHEWSQQTETHVLLVCVRFPLLYGENLDRRTKPSPLPNPCLPFLPNQPTSLAAPPPPTRPRPRSPPPPAPSLHSRQALSLSSSLVLGRRGGERRAKSGWRIGGKRRAQHTGGRQKVAGGAGAG